MIWFQKRWFLYFTGQNESVKVKMGNSSFLTWLWSLILYLSFHSVGSQFLLVVALYSSLLFLYTEISLNMMKWRNWIEKLLWFPLLLLTIIIILFTSEHIWYFKLKDSFNILIRLVAQIRRYRIDQFQYKTRISSHFL